MNIPNLPNLPLDSNGWSILTPSADTVKIYVSATGNDANDGLSEAKPLKTLKAGVAKLRNNSADWLLLKAGEVWDESMQVWGKNGRSPTERIVISSYGGTARPVISLFKATGEGIRVAKSKNVAVVGIQVKAADKSPNHPSYNPKAKRYHGISVGELNTHNVLIEDCYVELWETNILLVFVTDDATKFNSNIVVRRNVLTDSWSPGGKAMNLYASGMVDFRIEENVFDRGGHVPSIPDSVQTGFSHNIYLSSNNGSSYVYKNILARPASHGAQQRAGGLIKDNLTIDCPWHYLVGLHDSETCYNVGLGSGNLPTTKLGFGIEIKSAQNSDVHHNLIANKQVNIGGWPAYKFTFNSTDGFIGGTTIPLTHNAVIKVHDNVAYKWNANEGVMRIDTINDSDVSVTNNKLFEQGYPQSTVYYIQLGGAKKLFADNKYSTDQPLSNFSRIDGAKSSFDTWKAKTGDNSVVGPITFPDTTRTVETYCTKIGLKPTVNDFMVAAKKQSKSTWNPALRATIVNDYIREGFGLPILNNPSVVVKPVVEKIFLRDIATKKDIQELREGDTIVLSKLPSFNFRAELKDGTSVRLTLDADSVLEINDPYCYPHDDKPAVLTEKAYTLTAIGYGNDDGVTNPGTPLVVKFTVRNKPPAKIDLVVITDTNGDSDTFKSTPTKTINKVTLAFSDGTTTEVVKG